MTEPTVPPDPAFQQVDALRRVFTQGFSAASLDRVLVGPTREKN